MKFKLKDLFKRTTATTLAIACFVTSACFLPIEELIAFAADNGLKFYFADNVTNEAITEGPVLQVLEGVSVNIDDNLSEYSLSTGLQYTYNTETPLELTNTAGSFDVSTVSNLFNISTSTGNVNASMRPLVGFTTVEGAKTAELILNPIVQYSLPAKKDFAINNFSYYRKHYPIKDDETIETLPGAVSRNTVTAQMYFETGDQIHFTSGDNYIEFNYKYADTGEYGTEGWIPNYTRKVNKPTASTELTIEEQYVSWVTNLEDWTVSDQKGYFVGYDLHKITPLDTKSDKPFDVHLIFELRKSDDSPILYVDVNFGQYEDVSVVKPTGFNINFPYVTTENKLSFQVVNRADAVNDIVDIISSNETHYQTTSAPNSNATSPSIYLRENYKPFIYDDNYVADDPTSYIQLDAIQDYFYLKTRHVDYQYTNGFYIQWEWVPDPQHLDGSVSHPGEAPKREDFFDDDGNLKQEDWEKAQLDYLEKETAYNEQVKANQEIYDVLEFKELGVEEKLDADGVGTGTWGWTDSSDLSAGNRRVTVNRMTDDIEGELRAKVFIYNDSANFDPANVKPADDTSMNTSFYDGSGNTTPIISTKTAAIPIKITGSGVKPTWYITETTAATYDAESRKYNQYGKTFTYGIDEKVEEFPVYKLNADNVIEDTKETRDVFNMDMNDGVTYVNSPPAEVPLNYNPPIPIAPHTAKGSINFGSGIERADRLVITNNTTASSTASGTIKLHKSNNYSTTIEEFTFDENGQTWEISVPINPGDFNGLDSYIYSFTLLAHNEGMLDLDLDFYGSDSTLPKHSTRMRVSIGSSVPSSEAKLDKVYLHLVQDVVNPSSLTEEEKRVQEVLETLYSDKSVENAKDNPLAGQIPTDILYNVDFTYENGYYFHEMKLPYVISDVMLTPVYDGISQAGGAYNIEVKDPSSSVPQVVTGTGSPSGDFAAYTKRAIELISPTQADSANSTAKWIEITTLAADNATSERYYLKLVQESAELTIALEDLYVDSTDLIGEPIDLPLTNASGTEVEFVPELTGVRYYVTLPYYYYSQEIPVNISAISSGSWAKAPQIVSDDGLSPLSKGFFGTIKDALSNSTTESFMLNYEDSFGTGTNTQGSKYPNKFTITTYSESSNESREYYLTIYINPPDKNDDLKTLEVMDPTKDDTVLPFKNGVFLPIKDDYIVEIPYELQKYRFSMMPDSENALAVRLIAPDGTILGSTKFADPETPIQFLVDFAELGLGATDLDFTFTVAVQSEDGVWSDTFNHPEGHLPYTILFQRSAPNSDSLLSSLDVLNFEDASPIPEYVFEQVKKDYIFTVPYTTERIIIKPTAVEQDRTTITLNGVDFPDEDPGKDYYLTAGETNTFTIIVTAEDPSYSTTYNLYITRSNPDSEARLLNLVVDGADSMTPALFKPSVYTYDVTIPVGTKTYTITPTAVSEYSIILIDNIVIPSGTPTQPYEAVDEKTTIKVLVSAQDGVSTQTYTLNITNHNLIDKSDEALLLDVNIQGVDIEPKFKSNIYDYEVYTKIDTTTLDITPTISPNASVTVSVGSKKLDELNNIFSTSFFTDTDIITIVVTSESGAVTNTYKFTVYKNNEDKSGIFKPITDEDIDWNVENPIVVDITKYTVVDASVFNTLKDKYPDKTLVFNGSDYMFRVTGSDITKSIPHTVQYDLGMSFTSPEEPKVQAILDSSEYDEDTELEPIYVYFNDHGALPAQMVLTVILGSSVGDQQLYWNYYNTEFDRIDYYGYVQSNSKGTITVPIAHFSTYLVSTHQIYVSEDRTNTGFGSLDKGNHSSGQSDGSIGTEGPGDDLTGGFGSSNGGNITGGLSDSKPNPQTDVDTFPTTNSERVNYEQTTVKEWYDERKKQNSDNEQDD